MPTAFSDISLIADGPFGTTNIDLTNNSLVLTANSNIALSINSNGKITAGNAATTPVTFYVNGSFSSSLNNSATTSGTITLDLSTSNNFTINLSSTTLLGIPMNATAGQSGIIFFVQPITGNVSIAFDPSWKWPNGIAPSATPTANAVDAVAYIVRTGNPFPVMAAQFISNFS